jgi:hypothetical protein
MAVRMVMSALAWRMHSSTGGVADFQAGVPQTIEHGFGDGLAPSGLLVGQEEQQIDIGAGRLQPAAITAGRDHRHVLGVGRILRWIEMLLHELVENADDLVFHPAQPLGTTAAVTIFEQQLLGLGAALVEGGLQPLGKRRAHFLVVAGMRYGEVFEVGDDGFAVDQFRRRPGRGFGAGAG